jgi:hypothetical protein
MMSYRVEDRGRVVKVFVPYMKRDNMLGGLNPTSVLPGAISLAEPVRMKEN